MQFAARFIRIEQSGLYARAVTMKCKLHGVPLTTMFDVTRWSIISFRGSKEHILNNSVVEIFLEVAKIFGWQEMRGKEALKFFILNKM